jgi:hypothetical protein
LNNFHHQLGIAANTALSLFQLLLTSQLPPSKSLCLSMSLLWLSPLIFCGQVSQDVLNSNFSLFLRTTPSQYLSLNQEVMKISLSSSTERHFCTYTTGFEDYYYPKIYTQNLPKAK